MVHFIWASNSFGCFTGASQASSSASRPNSYNFGRRKGSIGPVNILFDETRTELDLAPASYSRVDEERGIVLPRKITPKLAEEIGMHLGDGFLSLHRNEYRLKGSPFDEREFYQGFVAPLYKELFNLEVKLKDYGTSYGFEACSKALWTFKSKVLKIPVGRKTGIRVPEIIKVNDREVLAGFLRGYFDTDGSVSFTSRYGYPSYYPTISAASASEFLIRDVAEILSMFGLRPTVWRNRDWWEVQLRGYNRFLRFLELIGWSSKKHVDKINAWRLRYPQLACGASGEVVSHGPVEIKSMERPEADFDSRLAPSTLI